MQKIDL
jgi:hypothetical protein